jgi:ATP-dependent DNA helicase RecG
MNQEELLKDIALLEDGKRQFKVKIESADSLAAEMAAFANSEGGTIYIGVANDGTTPGLDPDEVNRLNQMISNVASQNIKSPINISTENIKVPNGKLVVVVRVPEGKSKPYIFKNGVIWIKKGSDKRKITSREEILRLFQSAGDYRGDEEESKAGIDKIDKLRFRDYLKKEYSRDYPDTNEELLQILQNINLATDKGKLNKAGVLLFAEHPEWIYPEFVIKAIRFPGNNIHATDYIDDEKIEGPLPAMYEKAMSFIKRNLRNIQAGQGVNAPGKLEIPEEVFEELLVNALTHRDYFISAPIRIFILDNRIEIISPGDLPNHLTVNQIKKGQTNIRNRIIASFVSNGLLPYRGIGTGVRRALDLWPDIKFDNDSEGSQFTVSIKRKELIKTIKIVDTLSPESSVKSSEKTEQKILKLMKDNPEITMAEISRTIGVSESAIEKQIAKLRINNKIRRIGSRKDGSWKVIEKK